MNKNPEAVEQHQRAVVGALVWRTCLNCEHFVERKAGDFMMVCSLAGSTPPPAVIVHGCRQWLAAIPF